MNCNSETSRRHLTRTAAVGILTLAAMALDGPVLAGVVSPQPGEVYREYTAVMADATKAEGAPAITEMLTGSETLANVVEIAISLEKEAILFYLGLKDKVPASLGGDKIDGIIEEEKKHVVMLSRKLKDLRDAQ